MSRSSSERSPPRLGAKSGAKLLLPGDMAKFFRNFFKKKFQRKRNGLKTSHVGKMFFSSRRGQRGSQRGKARERGGLEGRPPGRGLHCWRVAATKPRHGERGLRHGWGGQGGWLLGRQGLRHCGAAAWQTGLAALRGVARRHGGRHCERTRRGGRDGAAAWRTGLVALRGWQGGWLLGRHGGRHCGAAARLGAIL